jgi:HEAT repeat protein
MKTNNALFVALTAGFGCALFLTLHFAPALMAARYSDEQGLIDVLKSNATLQEKDEACAGLKRVGTARAVPVLAGLLLDKDLTHSARYALESMAVPEAGLALVEALQNTSGMIRVGVINSVGWRREAKAVPELSRLLGGDDLNVACAAAAALGRIGGEPATRSLLDGLSRKRQVELRNAILDGLLSAANQDLAEKARGAAYTIFEKLMAMPTPDHIRLAAYRGLIASADQRRALELVKTAIQGDDGPEQMAALEMARSLNSPELTKVLCESIPEAAPPMKVALIEALRQRGDTAAAPSLAAMIKNPDHGVRIAALTGLGEIGDVTAVSSLLEASCSNDEAEMKTGRQALLILRRGDVTQALIGQLTSGQPAARAEAARALAGRGDKGAVVSLFAAAGENLEPLRGAAFHALARLADTTHVPALVRLVAESKEEAALDEARETLSAVCLRLRGQGIQVDASPIISGIEGAHPKNRAALLQAGSVLSDESLRAAMRAALNAPDETLRDAAALALCDTLDPELLPDLLRLSNQVTDPGRRVQAVRGYIRLTLDPENGRLSKTQRVDALRQVLPLTRPEERWAILAGLARMPDPGALELALTMLEGPPTRAEAALAVTAIASGLAGTRREVARTALEKVMAVVTDPDQRKAAAAILQKIDSNATAVSPVTFRRIKVDGAFRSEGVAVADFNRDGWLDIATGNILYLGPDWKPQPMLGAAKEYKPEGYSDAFLCFAEDIDRDGWTDLIVVGFPGAKTRWLRNPGRSGGPWKEFLAVEKTGNESPEWVDVDKDGRKELVFVSEKGMAFASPGADPTKLWPIRVIASPDDPRPVHGLGVGDINGDGRNDVVCPEGWWEAPPEPDRIPWTFHRAKLGFEAPAQMLIMDVNGDGRADVVSSAAHRYGLWWYEQTPQGWKPHEIDHNISQLHALHAADLNGDGLPDLITGKRYWAHREGDEGIDDPAVICWFELRREAGKPTWIRHDIDSDSGVGLHFQIVDLNGDGLLDIVTSNKKGVYVFMQEKR